MMGVRLVRNNPVCCAETDFENCICAFKATSSCDSMYLYDTGMSPQCQHCCVSINYDALRGDARNLPKL